VMYPQPYTLFKVYAGYLGHCNMDEGYVLLSRCFRSKQV
jgi:hypothetical protein